MISEGDNNSNSANKSEASTVLQANREQLPILEYAAEIKEAIRNNDVTIIVGETGSGKTTEIPLMLQEIIPEGQKVAITQPRRVAARSVAHYVAEKAGTKVGEEIGYQVRFEDHTTEGTRIDFMTDGILLRKMQFDPLLREFSAVMVDEAHERSLNIDFTLGLLKRIQKSREEAGIEPLKIVVSSATLEKDKFSGYFDKAPVVEVPGRLYPVKVFYEEEEVEDYTEAAVMRAEEIIRNGKEGDILVFMPGQKEINMTIEIIKKMELPGDVLPLYGDMSPEEQDRVFKNGGVRKIIISTNIAETSVTIPGVRYVIDSGLIKQKEYDQQIGIEALPTETHSKSGCIQRAGRAGRLGPGECHRLYTEENFDNRQQFQTPEIQRSNLAHVVLQMKTMGIKDVETFEFIDPPEREAFYGAIVTLKNLGALDETEELTEIGKIMADLPLEPRLARMVVEADKYECVETICTIAALISGRSVFVRPRDKELKADLAHARFTVSGSDFLTLLKVWQEYEKSNYNRDWAQDNFLNCKVLDEVSNVRYQLFQSLKCNGIRATENADPEAIGRCITAGLIENLMEEDYRHSYVRVRDRKPGFFIHPSSTTFMEAPKLFVPSEIVMTSKAFARNIQRVKPEWLREIAPQLLKEVPLSISYEPGTDRVIQKVEVSLKGGFRLLVTEEREIMGEQAVDAFALALSRGVLDMPFDAHNRRVIDEIDKFCIRSGGITMERYPIDQLYIFYKEKLGDICSKAQLDEAMREGKVNLEMNLDDYVSAEEREKILAESPDQIMVLGKAYNIVYDPNVYGEEPNCTIRMAAEDLLKIKEQPRLPGGRKLKIKLVRNDKDPYTITSGVDLEELRHEAYQVVIKQFFDTWKKSTKAPSPRQVEINLLGDRLPEIPEPLQYGIDPLTKEPLVAYAAIKQEYSYDGNRFSIQYFASEDEAKYAQKQVVDAMRQAKIDEQKRLSRIAGTGENLEQPEGFLEEESNTPKSYEEIIRMKDYVLTRLPREKFSTGIDYHLLAILFSLEQDGSDVNKLEVERKLREYADSQGVDLSGFQASRLPIERNLETSKRLRVDEYVDLSVSEIPDLQQILAADRNKDIGHWRLAVAALASRGIDGIEELLREKVTDKETLDAVEKAVKKAQTEATTNRQGDLGRTRRIVADITKAIDIYRRIIAANNHELTNGFIGNDQEARIRFRKLFYERLKKAERLPEIGSLGKEIDAVLEEMTS